MHVWMLNALENVFSRLLKVMMDVDRSLKVMCMLIDVRNEGSVFSYFSLFCSRSLYFTGSFCTLAL
jgi:hypothetical protein